MERLFAPWRIEWIKREDRAGPPGSCVFCDLPGEEADRENLVVARSEHAYVLLNNYPYNPGHAMVIPYTHAAEFASLPDEELVGHARLRVRTFEALRAAFEPDGFNAGVNMGAGSGGSITGHVHEHVVPRWEGDTNYMPVVGETKVIVEAVTASYDLLHEAFAGLPGCEATGTGAVRVDLDR